MTPPRRAPLRRAPSFSGSRVLVAGLVCGAGGLAVALFLRVILANTTVRVNSYAPFWFTVLLAGFGFVAGMALESVRQLQQSSSEPEYHRHRSLRQPTELHRGATDDRPLP
jgi:hypothetical protein